MKKTNRVLDRTIADEGLSLIEVLIAMMIFAMIAIGVAYSLTSMMAQVKDARARVVATNLVAQEIDLSRGTGEVFALLDSAYPSVKVNGVSFQVKRTTQWVTDPLSTGACGVSAPGATGELKYKRVHVQVTWPSGSSMRSVSSDTLIAPKSRVSSASAGTLLVSVLDRSGNGIGGVTISVTPSVSPSPSATDAQGCIYIPNVAPGAYTVRVTSPAYVDSTQTATPASSAITLSAGKSGTATFAIGLKQPLTVKYGTAFVPKNLDTSFIHAADPIFVSSTTSAVNSRSVDLYPFAETYTVLAGKYRAANVGTLGCLSPNPAEWAPGNVAGTPVFGTAPPGVLPGVGASVVVPMGSLVITGMNTDTLTAESQASGLAGSGDPGCAALTMTYDFGPVLKNGTITVSLPYGTWKLYKGTTSRVQLKTELAAAPGTTALIADGLVTLDPRVARP